MNENKLVAKIIQLKQRRKLTNILDGPAGIFLNDEIIDVRYYDVVVEIDEAGKFVEILLALKIVDQAIKPTIDLMDIIGFTFDFGGGRLIDVATDRR